MYTELHLKCTSVWSSSMNRHLSDGEREILNQLNQEAAPDYEEIHSEIRKARKDHICNVCKRTIRKGDRYEKHVFRLDGVFQELKHHVICS
jgi:hypothetical protein